MKRVAALGLDVGRKRMGVAGCDGTGLIATGLTTIYRTSFAEDIKKIQDIVREREVEILVVGLPYTLDGNIGSQAKQVQKFANKISQILKLPLEYVDERLTSVEAEARLKASKKFSTRDKGAIDRQAAAIILQQWLDRRRSEEKVISNK
ncbi:Holliday junction resolvase RuvX [Waterburya agarophytonicola K14]|uniref:Putative pre-16S rRNA nuclease n=1 Tax=Waterburya agarophytonicola KI4 TaxID=2874699 RepID=A0A964BSH8_9CYAN|nr:Holliday junction resolvase RuvX [Waterburya agarophytonicola]MCC0178938.1 Holliday junction resolvase RuvX [Waterburya agarophytonicola KI4]